MLSPTGFSRSGLPCGCLRRWWPCRWDRHICVGLNAGGREGAAVAILARMVHRTSAAAVPAKVVVRWLPLYLRLASVYTGCACAARFARYPAHYPDM